jgi:P-type Ca2+ transporter type 2C
VGFAFVSSVISTDESSALTAVQLLWVNLIQDTLAALALATDPPTPELLDRQPEPKGSSLISMNMWKMIFGQSILQLVVIFVLNFNGPGLFPTWDDDTLKTVNFNIFVWLQIFNEISCRRLDDKLNVFSGIAQNSFFMIIMVIVVACQVFIISFGGAAFSVVPLSTEQWLLSIGLGFLSLPAGVIIRFIPNEFIKVFIPKRFLKPRNKDEERQIEDWDHVLEAIREDLRFYERLRGQRRIGSLGRKSPEATVRVNSPRQRRESFDSETGAMYGTNDANQHASSSLFSVNTAVALVPGLIALSLAVAPATTGHTSNNSMSNHEGGGRDESGIANNHSRT